MIETTRRGNRLAAFFAAALGCGLWLLAEAAPAEAQASRTRPGGGGGGSASSSSGSGSSSSGGSASSSSSGGSSSQSRVRVRRTRPPEGSSGGAPTVIEERRDPPRSGGSGGHFHHGHHGHHGFYGWPWYGYRYPYWSPYGWGWWLGWSGWYPSWDYYGYGYGSGGYPHPPYGGRVYPHGGPSMGALDTDVWPARTEVWIDGRYVGFVDQFDGFPRFLWLEKGTYDVVFYYQGFKTLARQYTIHPGLVIDVEDRLEPGEAIHPSALAPAET